MTTAQAETPIQELARVATACLAFRLSDLVERDLRAALARAAGAPTPAPAPFPPHRLRTVLAAAALHAREDEPGAPKLPPDESARVAEFLACAAGPLARRVEALEAAARAVVDASCGCCSASNHGPDQDKALRALTVALGEAGAAASATAV